MDAVREWASGRGWRFLLREREKTHAALRSLAEWAHFSSPYSSHWWEQHFSVSPLSHMHNLFKEEQQKENGGISERSGCVCFPVRLPGILVQWMIGIGQVYWVFSFTSWAQYVIDAVCKLNLKVTEWFRVPMALEADIVIGWQVGRKNRSLGTKVLLSFDFRKQALFLTLTALWQLKSLQGYRQWVMSEDGE